MSPSTPTLPVTGPRRWRRLFARTHPDAGGDHELFIWTSSVHEHVLKLGPGHAEVVA